MVAANSHVHHKITYLNNFSCAEAIDIDIDRDGGDLTGSALPVDFRLDSIENERRRRN